MVAEEDLDLLFVTYHPQQISLDEMLDTIRAHQFEVQVKDEE